MTTDKTENQPPVERRRGDRRQPADTSLLMHVCVSGRLWVAEWGHPSNQAVAYESIQAYAENPSEYMPDWVTEELEDFSPMALQHAVKTFYMKYGNDEEKRYYGVDDRPYSVCVYCHKLVRWDKETQALVDPKETDEPAMCNPPSREAGVAYAEHGHQSMWLTLGELRDRTAHLPDTFPITLDAQGQDAGPAGQGNSWYNVRLSEVPSTEEFEREQPASLLLDIADDFDTRQW